MIKHVQEMIDEQNKNMNREERLEHLILVQGSYLKKLGDLIRGKASRKDLKNFVDKYGIGK